MNFYENTEPEDWFTGEYNKFSVCTCPIHPRLYKRSLLIRKSFNISKKIEKATLDFCAQGEFEPHINGQRVSSALFLQTPCVKYKEFNRIDVTNMLNTGKNVLCGITANSWLNSHSHTEVMMNKNAIIAQLDIHYCDGSCDVILSDSSWRISFSPLTDNDLQYGERYNALLEQDGWDNVDLDDSSWGFAEDFKFEAKVPYVLRNFEPIEITDEFLPRTSQRFSGGFLFDFGVNCAGRCSIMLENTYPGQLVRINYYERINGGKLEAGVYTPVFYNLDSTTVARGNFRNVDIYICKGAKQEYYEPHFAFTGFRYILVEGCSSRDQIKSIQMNVMHNNIALSGKISSSYKPINEIFTAARRGFLSNMFNGPVDCPTREKNFWTGDAQVYIETACWLTNCHDVLARWSDAGRKMCPQCYGWGDEIYILPLALYHFYRDKEILKKRYDDILNFARSRTAGVLNGLPENMVSPFSDWLAPDNIVLDKVFFAHCYYCYMLSCVAHIAEILEDYKTADEFKHAFEAGVKAFNEKYFDFEENDYAPHLQSSLILPLAFKLTPKYRDAAVAKKLNEYILEKGYLEAGFIASRYVMYVLCSYGYIDTASRLLRRDDYPSWQYTLSTGATTFTETWRGQNDPAGDISMNHFTFGAVTGWMFEHLGGISLKSAPGFRRIVLQPYFMKKIGDFSAQYDSVSGRISTHWHFQGNSVIYDFDCPSNVTLILPDGSEKEYPAGSHSVEILFK